jgi:hypothetical protein
VFRVTSTILLALTLSSCGRGKEQAVTIVPREVEAGSRSVPGDPFGASSAAYERLREVTNEALASPWSGELGELAPWLEEQTVAIERSLALLKALRVGPVDVYAVANGRIALVYEHIATALTEGSDVAEGRGYESDWRGQEDLIWERANAFWARCVRSCGTGGAHLDAWRLRCRVGAADTEARLTGESLPPAPRQPK